MKDVHPDDVSKRLFIDIIEKALARAGSMSALGRQLGTDHRNLAYWKSGHHLPVYADMQRWFFMMRDYVAKKR